MLSLQKETNTVEYFHAETKTSYQLKPLTAKRYQQILARNTKADKVDVIGKMTQIAVEHIESWEGVGEIVDGKAMPSECDIKNKASFGEKFAYKIMPSITDKAMEAATSDDMEIDAAKNA